MENYFEHLLDKAQLFRTEIQRKLGSSGNVISTSDLNRGLRAEENENSSDEGSQDELDKDMKKFIYKSPADFFRNHKKNIEEFIDKHISKPIDNLTGDH